MELANASLLDESTAAAESMLMFYHMRSRSQVKNNVNKFFVSDRVFLQTKDVITARAEPLGIEIVYGNPATIKLMEIISELYYNILMLMVKFMTTVILLQKLNI